MNAFVDQSKMVSLTVLVFLLKDFIGDKNVCLLALPCGASLSGDARISVGGWLLKVEFVKIVSWAVVFIILIPSLSADGQRIF